jgi:hypothetical protein
MVIATHPRTAASRDCVRRPVGSIVQMVLASAGIFHTVEPDALAVLPTLHFACRPTVYAEGEPGDRIYIITSGKQPHVPLTGPQ